MIDPFAVDVHALAERGVTFARRRRGYGPMMVTSPLCSLGHDGVASMTRMLGRGCGDVTMTTVDRLRARRRVVVTPRRCSLDAGFRGVMAVMGRCGDSRRCVSMMTARDRHRRGRGRGRRMMVMVVSYGRWRGDRVMAVVMIRRGGRDARGRESGSHGNGCDDG